MQAAGARCQCHACYTLQVMLMASGNGTHARRHARTLAYTHTCTRTHPRTRMHAHTSPTTARERSRHSRIAHARSHQPSVRGACTWQQYTDQASARVPVVVPFRARAHPTAPARRAQHSTPPPPHAHLVLAAREVGLVSREGQLPAARVRVVPRLGVLPPLVAALLCVRRCLGRPAGAGKRAHPTSEGRQEPPAAHKNPLGLEPRARLLRHPHLRRLEPMCSSSCSARAMCVGASSENSNVTRPSASRCPARACSTRAARGAALRRTRVQGCLVPREPRGTISARPARVQACKRCALVLAYLGLRERLCVHPAGNTGNVRCSHCQPHKHRSLHTTHCVQGHAPPPSAPEVPGHVVVCARHRLLALLQLGLAGALGLSR